MQPLTDSGRAITQPRDRTTSSPITQPRDLKSRKPLILSVDDDDVNQEVVKGALGEDHDVHCAMDGPAALNFLSDCIKNKAELPDVVLLDIQMPGMTGFEVCEQIRSKMTDTHLRMPIIMVSARTPYETSAAEGYSKGATDYMCKPFCVQVLRYKVAVCLKLKAEMRSNAVAAVVASMERSEMRSPLANEGEAVAHTDTKAEHHALEAAREIVSLRGQVEELRREGEIGKKQIQDLRAALTELRESSPAKNVQALVKAEAYALEVSMERDSLRKQLEAIKQERDIFEKQLSDVQEGLIKLHDMGQKKKSGPALLQQKNNEPLLLKEATATNDPLCFSSSETVDDDTRPRAGSSHKGEEASVTAAQERDFLMRQLDLMKQELLHQSSGEGGAGESVVRSEGKVNDQLMGGAYTAVVNQAALQMQHQAVLQLDFQIVQAEMALKTACLQLEVAGKFATGCQELLPFVAEVRAEKASPKEKMPPPVTTSQAYPWNGQAMSVLASHLDKMQEVLLKSRELVNSQDGQLNFYGAFSSTLPSVPDEQLNFYGATCSTLPSVDFQDGDDEAFMGGARHHFALAP